jgi:oleate hydratase
MQRPLAVVRQDAFGREESGNVMPSAQFDPDSKTYLVGEGSKNLAFVGQYCELPDDVVFTVEYSVRSAQIAVYSLLGLEKEPPAVYKGHYDPRVLLEAFKALHEIGV